MPRIRCLFLVLGLFGCIFLPGCGKKTVTVKGTVVQGGKPITLSKTGSVQVTLVPLSNTEKGVTTIPIRPDPQGNFEAQDVPVGKYKIAVQVFDPTPQEDKLAGAHDVQKTKITREVDGKTPLNIDVSKPEG